MIDWSVNLGNVLNIAFVVAGWIAVIVALRVKVDALTGRLITVEQELTKMVAVMVAQGRHDERLNAFSRELNDLARRHDELANRFNREHNGAS